LIFIAILTSYWRIEKIYYCTQ